MLAVAPKTIGRESADSCAPACPVCQQATYRLNLNGRWARWRARWFHRLPYACAHCGWQGTLAATATSHDVIDQLPWFRARTPQRNDNAEQKETHTHETT